jgi:hypothetical protein
MCNQFTNVHEFIWGGSATTTGPSGRISCHCGKYEFDGTLTWVHTQNPGYCDCPQTYTVEKRWGQWVCTNCRRLLSGEVETDEIDREITAMSQDEIVKAIEDSAGVWKDRDDLDELYGKAE